MVNLSSILLVTSSVFRKYNDVNDILSHMSKYKANPKQNQIVLIACSLHIIDHSDNSVCTLNRTTALTKTM